MQELLPVVVVGELRGDLTDERVLDGATLLGCAVLAAVLAASLGRRLATTSTGSVAIVSAADLERLADVPTDQGSRRTDDGDRRPRPRCVLRCPSPPRTSPRRHRTSVTTAAPAPECDHPRTLIASLTDGAGRRRVVDRR